MIKHASALLSTLTELFSLRKSSAQFGSAKQEFGHAYQDFWMLMIACTHHMMLLFESGLRFGGCGSGGILADDSAGSRLIEHVELAL